MYIFHNAACSWIDRAMHLRDHELETCRFRPLKCDYCHGDVGAPGMAQHLANECLEKSRKCSLGCPKEFQWKYREAMETHERHECPKRNVMCGKCKSQMWASELTEHETRECIYRKVGRCPNAGCDIELLALEVEEHLSSQCLARLVRCPQKCSEEVRLSSI